MLKPGTVFLLKSIKWSICCFSTCDALDLLASHGAMSQAKAVTKYSKPFFLRVVCPLLVFLDVVLVGWC